MGTFRHAYVFDGRFQRRAFDAAEAYDLTREEDEEQEELENEEDGDDDDDDDDWEEDLEEEEEQGEGENDDADGAENEIASSRLPRLSPESSAQDDGGERPSELVLRFLPLLSEALRSKLRPGDDAPVPQGGAEDKEAEEAVADSAS